MNGFIRGSREGLVGEGGDGGNFGASLAFICHVWGPHLGPTKGEGRGTIRARPPEEGREEGYTIWVWAKLVRERSAFYLRLRAADRPAEMD